MLYKKKFEKKNNNVIKLNLISILNIKKVEKKNLEKNNVK